MRHSTRRYQQATDLDSWQSDARIAERGFVHAWESRVGEDNGEDFFASMLERLVGPDDVVLDVGCGHGELTLALADRARAAIGVDRDPGYLSLARELAGERGIGNVRFLELDFSTDDARLPLADAPVTLVVNRRGPTADKWLDEARRVGRPGTPVLVMHPAGKPPRPGWAEEFEGLSDSCFGAIPYDQVRSWVEQPLVAAGISDYQLWWFDVPEWFDTAEDLRRRLGLRGHKLRGGLTLRHQRLVAQFRLPAGP
ncbi:MAG TPA: class I SAM-dependent methyltransferase [Pseudonocardiaceae bacterium]|nr:class I SAM-dependent methyltransferase [Pseudonocardiaceae bacterium]